MATLFHKHHIIPKHMEGSNDPSNIIELTIKDHAEAHHKLYEQYGKTEDYVAWQGLLGNIGKDEYIKAKCSLGGRKNKGKSKPPISEETRRNLSISHKGQVISEITKQKLREFNKGKILSSDHKKKISNSLIGHKHTEKSKIKMSLTRQQNPYNLKPIKTPFGQFNSLKDASENLNIPNSTIRYKIKTKSDWEYI